MSELEKFKRRLIRIVARLHLKEKKPEDELWEDLKKETKCDCKWLWERMRTLTLKRLKRLIIADDRQDCITNIARMSLTDWLLYDLILVHEKIDVIGAELMGDKKVEPRPLFELFSLVQRFDLEGLTGEQLASAWTAATFYYNSNGRQCSPMLLQRRWHQMKEAARNRFYKFWYTYRGHLKMLHVAMNDVPTRLQMAIAKRYPHIITKTFLSWEDMIEKRMAILPDEFQTEMKKQSQALPKPSENDPDLVLLEPEIETIDLRVDSDSDNELKEQVQIEESSTISDIETANALAGIGATPKIEPEEIPMDEDFGDIEALENVEIPMEVTPMEIDDNQEISAANEQGIENSNLKIIQDIHSELIQNSDQLNESGEPAIIDKGDQIQTQMEQKVTDEEVEAVVDSTEELIQEPLIVPQITNVFGNVHIEVEALAKLSKILETKIVDPISLDVQPLHEVSNEITLSETSQTEIYSCDDDDEEIEDDIIKTEIIDENYVRPDFNTNVHSDQLTKLSVTKDDIDNTTKLDKNIIQKSENHGILFEEMATGFTFDDEGFELEDDGIVIDNDEQFVDSTKSQEDTSTALQTEDSSKDDKEEEGEEEMAKFDLKLLMDPVVITKKIDEMSIFKNINTLFNVRCKENIDLILAESKPVGKKSINVKEEKLQSPCHHEDDDHKINDDLFDNNNIKVEKVPSLCDSEDGHSKIDDDLFDNLSTVSDLEYVPENKKVRLTSTLLQKPRNRNYNSITLCKNPDFNTRLKRLTVGFLSLKRNRRLLKACKPLTIDVSRSFESKIINNTLYLKSCSNNEHIKKETDTDDKFNESEHRTSVMPSAMPVQSLIDITNTTMEDLINKQVELVHTVQKPIEENSILYERNKVINLPHIDNVRRINQTLLVAEVSPIQVHPAEVCIPPVQIIPHRDVARNEILQDGPNEIHTMIAESGEKESDISSGKVICSGTVIHGTNHQFITHGLDSTASTSKRPGNLSKRTSLEKMFDKYRLNASQHQFNRKRPERLDWTFGIKKLPSQTLQSYTDEYLITIDTLYKMLNLMDESKDNPVKTLLLKGSAKKLSKSKAVMKRKLELQEKLCEYERRIKGDLNRSPGTNISNMKPPPSLNQKKTKRPRSTKSTKSRTCQKEVNNTVDESMKNACESIESVIQQTRELIEGRPENTKTAMNTVDANTSTSDGNTVEKTTDTIEIDDTCIDINDTPIEITIELQDSTNSIQQTSITSADDMNIIDKSCTSVVLADTPKVNIISTNEQIPHSTQLISTPVDDVTPTPVPLAINSNIIEIDDSPLEVSVSEVQNTLSPNSISINQFKQTNDSISSLIPMSSPPKIKTRITSGPRRRRQRYTDSGTSGGRKYTYLPCVKDSNVNNDKVLFLSSKSLSKQPNAEPIFLGTNKILLTDVPLPRIQDINPNSKVISQYIDQSTVALPKGVDFVVLPNGELTCTIAPDTHLDYEQLALIPTLLSTLRQQLSSGIMVASPLGIPISDVTNATTAEDIAEVVNISDDENTPKNSVGEQLIENNSSNANVTASLSDDSQSKTSGTIIQNTNEYSSDVPNESNSKETSTLEHTDHVEVNSEKNIDESGKCDNRNTITSTLQLNIDAIPEIHNNDSANVNTPMDVIDTGNNADVETDTNRDQTNNDQSAAPVKKTILSDLMEMSGIFEEDTIPSINPDNVSKDVIATQPVCTPVLVVGTGQDASGSKVVTPSLVTDVSQVATGNTVVNLPELNPITSFAQLKYAFEKSGKFFKLDIATRVLAPINVCIKKKEKENNTAPAKTTKVVMVDLTDENDEPITKSTKIGIRSQTSDVSVTDDQSKQVETQKPISIKPLKLFKVASPPITESTKIGIRSQTSDVSVTDDQSKQVKTQKPISIKPIKLFKVTRPNILRGFSKKKSNAESKLVSILKRIKLKKRNQSSQEVKAKVNRIGTSEVNIVEDSDDSSDDEPLAKKVQRKKISTEVSAPTVVVDVEPVCENILSDNNRMEQTEDSLPIDNLEQAEKCLPIDDLEHVEDGSTNQEEEFANSNEITASESSLPTELSFISDHENNGSDEELCILGV